MRDVAAAAGVSITTASRVLGGSTHSVSKATAERVRTAAADLRYTLNASARAMRRASEAVALVADDLTTPSMGMVVAAMERQARKSGAFVTVSSTRATPDRQLQTVRLLRGLRPKALVLTSGRLQGNRLGERLLKELRAYEREGGRVVIVGAAEEAFDSIDLDNHGAGYCVGDYIARSGHRNVVVLGSQQGTANLSARASGFVGGLTSAGVPAAAIRTVNCTGDRRGGFEAARALAGQGMTAVDAVLAVNDAVAIGAMSALRDAGVSVPHDVSVTGIDDIQLAVDVTPQLTTFALPLTDMGATAIQLALADRHEPTTLTVQGHLVIRGSTMPRGRRAPCP
ncbi:LacI family DNA-binding transcriptional regulator [Streptomyces sp. KMM 9044]|uniref:LacI family DNA-binding transcriptional regulator n=1 Tax=Streptomyces sp. KMM 9044 TaxID=2744474 RepID=UPI00215147A0|nr:LacI family DNA-binding transcriptional regulator [Streptomyces sp. KMM 9044]WAX78634.1 LacI family DNA-binding transcriptional regulator [Streptomyces sp. KMM 9044]